MIFDDRNIHDNDVHSVNEDPKKITGIQRLTFVARYLERIGDHITNLCESVVFMVTGERVELN